MSADARERQRLRSRYAVLLVSAAAWLLLLVDPGGRLLATHHPTTHVHAASWSASLQMLLAMNPPASLAAGWMVMLVAMMTPTLIWPMRHLWKTSFTSRRVRTIVLFAAAYAAIWFAMGGVLLMIALAMNSWIPNWPLAVGVTALIAIAWQCSPVKQRCLNRCHAHSALSAFGAAADRDALRFGATHGLWCAASCWALMLVPLILPAGHLPVMALVAVVMFSERLEQPRPPAWRLRGTGKAVRIVIAQTRLHLQSRRPAAIASRVQAA